jgi:spore maturation protein CgeB
MRIFQVIEASTNAGLSGNRTWHRNLYEPLIDLGHDVVLFYAEDGRKAMERNDVRLRALFSERLLNKFRKEHMKKPFDLFFAYFKDGMVESSVIDEVRKTGLPTCNFSCNNTHQFYLVDELSPHFDYNLHSEKAARNKFLAIKANPLWWPMASNPTYFKPLDLPRSIQASFVGMNYALRARYIAHLLENGIDVQTFGPGWQGGAQTPWRSIAKRYKFLLESLLTLDPIKQGTASSILADHDFRRSLSARFPQNMHPPVTDEQLISLYSNSHISLGFLEVYNNHDPSSHVTQHLHLREFEAPMSGALYCTGYMDELTEMFEPDKEMLIYHSQHELLEKVVYYLAHPAQAEQVRLAGRKRALAEHTYHDRFRKLFKVLGLSK